MDPRLARRRIEQAPARPRAGDRLKEILGHADLKMTLRYAHLAPEHLRGEIVKTERRSPSAENVNVTITAQESLEEVRELKSIAAK